MRAAFGVVVGALLFGLTACASVEVAPAPKDAAGGTAYRLVKSLTTEVGPRLAGTRQEAAAREWAVRTLKDLKFSRVSVEPFTFAGWRRGAERATIVSHGNQELAVTALGGSVATLKRGITAPVAFVASFDDLIAAPPGAYQGRIVFVNDRMRATARAMARPCASAAAARSRRASAGRLAS